MMFDIVWAVFVADIVDYRREQEEDDLGGCFEKVPYSVILSNL